MPMLNADMIESKLKEVVIEDIDSDTMLEVFRSIYTGEAHNLEKIGIEILLAAEKYDLPKLKAMCSLELSDILCEGNIFLILLLADRANEENLQTACFRFIKR